MTEQRTVHLVVEGMHCTSCALTIDWEVEDLEGVVEAKTSYAKGVTKVTYDPARVTPDQIDAALGAAGFAVRPA